MKGDELKYWLCWNRVPGVGPTRFYRLLEVFGALSEAWWATAWDLKPVLGDKALAGWEEIKKTWDPDLELQKLERFAFRIYCYPDPDYPPLLKKIPDPPPVLYASGSFAYGDEIAVAIVGTRTPSPSGSNHARELSSQLAHQGLTVVSGMARGIDSDAHRGALNAGGRTIAVLGSGLDVPYPPENEGLMREVAAHGVVISEFPLSTQPVAKNFPARNRIISGLSLGVVVVEAASDSGSLITAGFALEQGREVFAVPGNISSEGSKGPHKLIRQGAKLVENYQDILTELSLPMITPPETDSSLDGETLTPAEQQVISFMSREPQHVDQIQRRANLPAAQVNAILVQMELKGIVKRFPGQLYMRLK